MIDFRTAIPLDQAAQLVPGRKDKTASCGTLRRWATAGVKGVCLETVRIGGRVCTSVDAIQRFVDASTRTQQPQLADSQTSQSREVLRARFGI